MTATLPTPTRSKSPTSRRALLAGALGGLGALAASAIARVNPVRAGVDGDVVLGASNTTITPTSITNTTVDDNAFSAHASGAGVGVFGSSDSSNGTGVSGSSKLGPGVFGSSGSGTGVSGHSDSYIGVRGFSAATDQPATVGWSGGNSTGLLGYSNDGSGGLPAAPAKTAVYGYANQDSTANGVKGESGAGIGVYGLSSSYFGVYGQSSSSTGVFGRSGSNVGVSGFSSATSWPGIAGRNGGNSTGIFGYSSDGELALPPSKPKTGVYGYADQDSTSRGVIGESPAGIGVLGQSNGTGVGVRAYNTNNAGLGLRVSGKAAFDRSGKLTISSGHASGAKTGIALSSASFVLATLQTNVAGLFIQAVVSNPGASSFTIFLNEAPSVNVVVAWLAVN